MTGPWRDPSDDTLRLECGVFGVFGTPGASAIAALGLHALQHRGQEACGIAAFDGQRFHTERHMGHVGDAFGGSDLEARMPGAMAIGHTRYSTAGGSFIRTVQPMFADLEAGGVALAHNGNLTNFLTLRERLVGEGAIFQSTSDSEVILHLLARSRKAKVIDRFIDAVRQIEGGSYEIIAGERRWRASRLAGLDEVPVVVRELEDRTVIAMALIENIQREDLNPLEEAQGIRRLTADFGLTHEQAAQAVGKSRSAASNLLRLLNLTEPVQTMLMAGDIDMGHARALLALDGAAQITAANQVSAKKLSVREAESLVKKLSAEFNLTAPRKPAAGADKSGDVRRVEEELSDLLTAQVEVRVKKRARGAQAGEVAIQFGSLDELNGLIERLRASGG